MHTYCHPDILIKTPARPRPLTPGMRRSLPALQPSVRPRRSIPARALSPDLHCHRLAADALPRVLFPLIGLLCLLYIIAYIFATVFYPEVHKRGGTISTSPICSVYMPFLNSSCRSCEYGIIVGRDSSGRFAVSCSICSILSPFPAASCALRTGAMRSRAIPPAWI